MERVRVPNDGFVEQAKPGRQQEPRQREGNVRGQVTRQVVQIDLAVGGKPDGGHERERDQVAENEGKFFLGLPRCIDNDQRDP